MQLVTDRMSEPSCRTVSHPWSARLWRRSSSWSVYAGIALAMAGCGEQADGASRAKTNADGTVVRPCDDELKDQCGSTCDTAVPCAAGLYCLNGACTADCTPQGAQCSGTCLSDGHCLIEDGTPDLIGDNDSIGDGDGTACVQQGLEFESLTPSVVLLIDRSASMNADFGEQDRWNTIRNILVDPAEGFVSLLQNKVRFGLMLYTGFDEVSDEVLMPECVSLVETPIGLDNYAAISAQFLGADTGDDTPTAESVVLATEKLAAYQEIGPKVIVLATDGDPDTCAAPDSNGSEPPRAQSLAAVQSAFDQNIATYVISVGDEIADLNHLTELAQAGRGGDPTADFYPALDANSLVDAFSSILRGVVSCDFELNGTVLPEAVSSGSVSIDGMALNYRDDWEMVSSSSIRILGAACDKLKLTAARVDISFPCGAVLIR